MIYGLIIALFVLILCIFFYHYYGGVKEGNQNKSKTKDDNWIKTKNAWGISFNNLLQEVNNNNKNILQLKKNIKKYNSIYECLQDRVNIMNAKTEVRTLSNKENKEEREKQGKEAINKLRTTMKLL